MNICTLDMQWLLMGLNARDLSITKSLRDFMMDCLYRHRLGNCGDFEVIIAVYNSRENYRFLVERNRYAAENEPPSGYFCSYWEIPSELINGRPNGFLSITTFFGMRTEFGYVEYQDHNTIVSYRELLRKDRDALLRDS